MHAKKPLALSVAGGLASSCMEGIAHAWQLAAFGFFVLVWICFLRFRSGLWPRAPSVSRDPGGALLCTFWVSKGSGMPVMISRACGYRFFPSDRYMTEDVKSGSMETKNF